MQKRFPFKSKRLSTISEVIHGFGTRGVELPQYLEAMGFNGQTFFETDQIHSNVVHRLPPSTGQGKSADEILRGDVFITNEKGLVCFVRTADCVPILIVDVRNRAIAAVHAGWRGTSLDAAGRTIGAMEVSFGTRPSDCIAAIGPRICADCYEVGGDVIEKLLPLRVAGNWQRGRFVDLGSINRALLIRAGVPSGNIDLMPQCTFCDESFASWRRDKDENERQVNFIAILCE